MTTQEEQTILALDEEYMNRFLPVYVLTREIADISLLIAEDYFSTMTRADKIGARAQVTARFLYPRNAL